MKLQVVQIIDITQRIKYNHAIGERKLLQLINACVSHEMRNPINAIHCQNLEMKDIYGKMQECLNQPSISFQKLKKKLRKITSNLDQNILIN